MRFIVIALRDVSVFFALVLHEYQRRRHRQHTGELGAPARFVSESKIRNRNSPACKENAFQDPSIVLLLLQD
jgi:hypothetical protein